MPLSLKQFFGAVERDKELLEAGKAPKGVHTCNSCGVPLQESVTGNRPGELCSDCYFDKFGEELDAHPIGSLRVSRGG